MTPPLVRIPVRSRRQAMDWSLVLVSQGIETMIDHAEAGSGWSLTIAAQDSDAASRAIRQYLQENRRWRWRQPLPWPGLLFDWGSVAWAAVVILFYWLGTARTPAWRIVGVMDSSAVASGEWWRLFTAVWLHGDLAHLATNVTIGVLLLGLMMGRFGTGLGLLAAYLAGAGGNLAALFVYPEPHRSLGASGMIMAGLGLLAVQSVTLARQIPNPVRYIFTGVLGGIMLFVLLGLSPGTDVIAHLGGFLFGVALGAALAFAPALACRNPRVNLACGLLLALLTIVPWWLAIERGR